MARPARDDVNPAPLAFRLHHLGRRLADELDQCVAEHDITVGQAKFLRLIVTSPEGLTLAELATRARCTRANVTQQLDRLEARGFARRSQNADDGRSQRAFPTRTGKQAVERAVETLRAFEHRLVARLGEKKADTLWEILELLG